MVLFTALNTNLHAQSYVTWNKTELASNTSKQFNWSLYELLILCTGTYSNIEETIIVPTSMFEGTTSSYRPILTYAGNGISIYKSETANMINILTGNLVNEQTLTIYGIIKK